MRKAIAKLIEKGYSDEEIVEALSFNDVLDEEDAVYIAGLITDKFGGEYYGPQPFGDGEDQFIVKVMTDRIGELDVDNDGITFQSDADEKLTGEEIMFFKGLARRSGAWINGDDFEKFGNRTEAKQKSEAMFDGIMVFDRRRADNDMLDDGEGNGISFEEHLNYCCNEGGTPDCVDIVEPDRYEDPEDFFEAFPMDEYRYANEYAEELFEEDIIELINKA